MTNRSAYVCVSFCSAALKGRDIPAQGNALGSMVKNMPSPEGARQRLCRPFRAGLNDAPYPGRCPGLVCAAPLVLKTAGVAAMGALILSLPAITQPPQVRLDGLFQFRRLGIRESGVL